MITPFSKVLVSPSQVNTFSRCPYQWYLSTVEGWKPKFRPDYLSMGTLVHKFLQAYYKGVRMHSKSPWENVKQAISEQLTPSNNSTEQMETLNNLRKATKIVDRYCNEFAPLEDQGVNILSVEEEFEAECTSPEGQAFKIRGIVDLLVEIEGQIWIVDHKGTGNASFWSEQEISSDIQLPLYQLILEQQGVDVFGIIYNFYNRYVYKNPEPLEKLFRRVRSYRTDVELRNIMIEFGRSVDDMVRAYEMLDQGIVPRRSQKRDCASCWYFEPCQLGMKGINPDHALENGFIQNKRKKIEETTSGEKSTFSVKLV